MLTFFFWFIYWLRYNLFVFNFAASFCFVTSFRLGLCACVRALILLQYLKINLCALIFGGSLKDISESFTSYLVALIYFGCFSSQLLHRIMVVFFRLVGFHFFFFLCGKLAFQCASSLCGDGVSGQIWFQLVHSFSWALGRRVRATIHPYRLEKKK